ncbi:hypothetical protein SAMN04487982_110142 [Streptomyces sp. ok210]|nr:hypothetical protein SAMN04487982_110142 [Streptomyces sp. ok210]
MLLVVGNEVDHGLGPAALPGLTRGSLPLRKGRVPKALDDRSRGGTTFTTDGVGGPWEAVRQCH